MSIDSKIADHAYTRALLFGNKAKGKKTIVDAFKYNKPLFFDMLDALTFRKIGKFSSFEEFSQNQEAVSIVNGSLLAKEAIDIAMNSEEMISLVLSDIANIDNAVLVNPDIMKHIMSSNETIQKIVEDENYRNKFETDPLMLNAVCKSQSAMNYLWSIDEQIWLDYDTILNTLSNAPNLFKQVNSASYLICGGISGSGYSGNGSQTSETTYTSQQNSINYHIALESAYAANGTTVSTYPDDAASFPKNHIALLDTACKRYASDANSCIIPQSPFGVSKKVLLSMSDLTPVEAKKVYIGGFVHVANSSSTRNSQFQAKFYVYVAL